MEGCELNRPQFFRRSAALLGKPLRRAAALRLGAYAGSAAFFLLLSLLPALMLLSALLRFTPLSSADLLALAAAVMPAPLMPLMERIVREVFSLRSAALISVSALSALWSASRGVAGITDGLNAIFSSDGQRSALRRRLTAAAHTLLLLTALLLTLALNVLSRSLVAAHLPHLNRAPASLLFSTAALTVAFTLLYHVLPDRTVPVRFCFPAALLSALSWQVFSSIFSIYAVRFNRYTTFYGSLAAIALFMLWLQICMYILLCGGLLASTLEARQQRPRQEVLSMFFTKDAFIAAYQRSFSEIYSKPLRNGSVSEQYEALVKLIAEQAALIGTYSAEKQQATGQKQVYYFSMEFLIGRLLDNYLLNLGIRDLVADGLKDCGIALETLLAQEPDPGLGNGGLGRLAACFLDSMAMLGVAGAGMGLRYRYGLFRQKIDDGYQKELPDAWLENGYPWECAKPADLVEVRFGGEVERRMVNGELEFTHKNYHSVGAVPYDVPIVGYGGDTVNTLRLWHAQPIREQFDMAAFHHGDYAAAFRDKAEIDAITCMLYPDDSTPSGRQLRLKQEYFLVAAGIGSIVRSYLNQYGPDWDRFPDRISIHTNDTHPALCAPELMRVLLDDYDLPWDQAWSITCRTCSYTNHTILPEALEKWPVELLQELLPRVYMIVEEIDRRYRASFDRTLPGWQDKLERTAVLSGGEAHMANLSVICSSSVNGVAALHTEILKSSVLKDFYDLRPEIFHNETNGVSHRRFLIESNPGLAKLISEAIGDGWITHPEQLTLLEPFANDAAFLQRLAAVKRENKVRLSNYIARTMEISVDPDSVFDVQVKRIHAYKRQLLNAFKVLNLYNALKADPHLDLPPQTFLFAGKAAQGYALAKEIIKFICSIADLVNSDPEVSQRIKVLFVENFCVSNAQIIYPAADISEQISTAGKEASGTGNMKFMFNGALTLGTEDGANVEIRDLVGADNIFIFGLNAAQTMAMHENRSYHPDETAAADPRLSTILQQLVSGFFARSGCDFWRIYDALLREGDEFFVLADFDSYDRTWRDMVQRFGTADWNRKSLINIARSGFFSSDRTIRSYCDEIWHTPYHI